VKWRAVLHRLTQLEHMFCPRRRSSLLDGEVESERLELSAPFRRRIAEPLDADAAGQATFYGRFDKIGREEGERDGHIDPALRRLGPPLTNY